MHTQFLVNRQIFWKCRSSKVSLSRDAARINAGCMQNVNVNINALSVATYTVKHLFILADSDNIGSKLQPLSISLLSTVRHLWNDRPPGVTTTDSCHRLS